MEITEDMMNEQFRILDERGISYEFKTFDEGKYICMGTTGWYLLNRVFACRCHSCLDEKQLRQGCECWLANIDWLIYFAEGKKDLYTSGKIVNGLTQRILNVPLRLY